MGGRVVWGGLIGWRGEGLANAEGAQKRGVERGRWGWAWGRREGRRGSTE